MSPLQRILLTAASIAALAIVGGAWYFISGGTAREYPMGKQTSVQPSHDQNTLPPTPPEAKPAKHRVTLMTSMGEIQFAAYDSDAPRAVQNFITLAKKGFYNGITFHRVIKGFMIQGGDPKGDGTGGPGYVFADELNPETASYREGYKKGVVAMANAGPNTNGSQFFIMLEDYPLPHSYSIFGKVEQGQNVVDAIGSVSTGINDRPMIPVIIKSVKVEDASQ